MPEPLAPAPLVDVAALTAARERAFRLLTDRYADDSIPVEEFERRLDLIHAAASPQAVDRLVADLAVAPPRPAPLPLPAPRPIVAPDDEERRLLAVMSERRFVGRWAMPRILRTRAIMSEVRFDYRDVDLPLVAELDLLAVMANVQIIVPPGVAVELDVSPVMSSARSDAAEPSALSPGARRLRVRGTAVMSEVRVKVRTRD